LSVRQDKLRERDNQSNEQDQQDLGRILASSDDVARFPLVVLDEAAQCTEPALMCALVAARADQLVMVGDTKQLPPTVASSSKALRESIGISPMERLEKSGLVRQTTLRIQYRMVQALLDHPSKYFYKGMVKSAAEFSPVDQNSLSAIDPPPSGFAWPNAILPLAFIDGGRGEAEVLHDSSLGLAGRSNPTEAKLVAQITADILEENELKSSQICVLTPYSKQVSVIRSTLEMESINRRYRKRNIDRINDDTMSNTQLTKTKATDMLKSINDVRVGTIDSFQGQETEVVIFSAVRSNSFAGLGFLRDPRRLCVALTRARKGLIIIGDSSVLKSCRHWRSLIESCQDRNCFINENHHSLSPSSNRNTKECDSDGDDNGRLETFIDGNNVGKVDEHQRNMKEREKLSMLKPDEEFLGLFSTQSCDSTEP
jgi:regulator of nonsense transcripts 1